MKGENVQGLQVQLKQTGYEIDDEENGHQRFGKSTRQAVLACQEEQGLEQTGVVEEETAARLEAAMKPEEDDGQNRLLLASGHVCEPE
jgi:peptidoglycan hydrolase-like protein with peptidoglycan-binding domain